MSVPNLYLDELRLELQERSGVMVSTSTVWRSLVNAGYSMKKVCDDIIPSTYTDSHYF